MYYEDIIKFLWTVIYCCPMVKPKENKKNLYLKSYMDSNGGLPPHATHLHIAGSASVST